MDKTDKSKHEGFRDSLLHFMIGGFSGMFATIIIQPIDTLKVQIQILSEKGGKSMSRQNKSMFWVLKEIHNKKGLFILYRGLDSAILRQLFYASARLGSYTWAVERLKRNGRKIGMI